MHGSNCPDVAPHAICTAGSRREGSKACASPVHHALLVMMVSSVALEALVGAIISPTRRCSR
eukprot:CAMPEP_0203985176 /NCGR_PEP_ID=MMETSP0360-20130528/5176_1 /ASSEMBLY_ACC=CAM_ASM_000342 /TAXON_ID=268821 /ORGANISM="Scrippsiella Hangoei, Strain SHTV-5" /LENGTH=61 /DNA_ID=CAMNT_0050924433 /DNA_START=120 /DNA_END=302 /DNA_ORIENTATION=+